MAATCACGCGGSLDGKRPSAKFFSDACRKRFERSGGHFAGRLADEAQQWTEAARRMLDAVLAAWDPDGFRATSAASGRSWTSGSLLNLMPIVQRGWYPKGRKIIANFNYKKRERFHAFGALGRGTIRYALSWPQRPSRLICA